MPHLDALGAEELDGSVVFAVVDGIGVATAEDKAAAARVLQGHLGAGKRNGIAAC